MTFVAASRTVQASTASTVGRQRHRRAVDRRLDAGGVERRARALELGVERGLAVAADRLAHLAQRVAGDGLDVGHVGRGPSRGRAAGACGRAAPSAR